MADYELYQGDCLEIMPTLEDGSVAMCFADLPYGSAKRKTTDLSWDSQIAIETFWPHVWRCCTGVFASTATQPFASSLICSQLRYFRYDLIWHKSNVGGWLNANRAPLRAHESVLVFAKKQSIYNPQKINGKPYKCAARKPPLAFEARQKRGSTILLPTENKNGKRFPISVLKFDRCKNAGLHPTQKPVALLEWLIATYTNPGDTVLDPVMGSGTTGVACANLGRRFVGIEKDPTYFAAAKARIESAYADAQAKLAI